MRGKRRGLVVNASAQRSGGQQLESRLASTFWTHKFRKKFLNSQILGNISSLLADYSYFEEQLGRGGSSKTDTLILYLSCFLNHA